MEIRNVSLKYYKENGTFYTVGGYTTAAENWRIWEEILSFKKGEFPGLSKDSSWNGYIYVSTVDGFSQIVRVGNRE